MDCTEAVSLWVLQGEGGMGRGQWADGWAREPAHLNAHVWEEGWRAKGPEQTFGKGQAVASCPERVGVLCKT